jgi:hypothetical protein
MELMTWLRAEWDRVLGWGAVGLAVVALLLGYHGVSESLSTGRQLAYIISGGVGGLILVAVGVTLLVSADLHDEWRKLDQIEEAIRTTGASAGGDDDRR